MLDKLNDFQVDMYSYVMPTFLYINNNKNKVKNFLVNLAIKNVKIRKIYLFNNKKHINLLIISQKMFF